MFNSPRSNTLYFGPTPAKNSADGGLPLEHFFFLVVIPAVVHLITSTLKTPDIQYQEQYFRPNGRVLYF